MYDKQNNSWFIRVSLKTKRKDIDRYTLFKKVSQEKHQISRNKLTDAQLSGDREIIKFEIANNLFLHPSWTNEEEQTFRLYTELEQELFDSGLEHKVSNKP